MPLIVKVLGLFNLNELFCFTVQNKTCTVMTVNFTKFLGFLKCSNLMKKCAFTLAEVLITLGIIGVVAAITLPTVINNQKMKSYEVGFKKQYSVIQNAIDYLVVEESASDCYITYRLPYTSYQTVNSGCANLKSGLIDKLQLVKVPKYTLKRINTVPSNGGIVVNSSMANNTDYDNKDNYYMLKDGAVVNLSLPIVIVDVNGKKGPNKWGYDAFYMTLIPDKSNTKLLLSDKLEGCAEKGGLLPRTILRNQKKNTDTTYSRD